MTLSGTASCSIVWSQLHFVGIFSNISVTIIILYTFLLLGWGLHFYIFGSQTVIVGWNRQLNGHEFEQALGDGEGQGSLVCCSPWDHKESDTTERLN